MKSAGSEQQAHPSGHPLFGTAVAARAGNALTEEAGTPAISVARLRAAATRHSSAACPACSLPVK